MIPDNSGENKMTDKIREKLFTVFKKESALGKLTDKFFTKEIISYLFFGVMTTAVNWVVYTAFVKFLGVNITVSNAVAWIAAVIFAYFTNKIFVFESKSFKPLTLLKELVSFIAARALTGVIEIFGTPLLVKIGLSQKLFGIDGAVAKIIISVIVIILNYVFSKILIFRKK